MVKINYIVLSLVRSCTNFAAISWVERREHTRSNVKKCVIINLWIILVTCFCRLSTGVIVCEIFLKWNFFFRKHSPRQNEMKTCLITPSVFKSITNKSIPLLKQTNEQTKINEEIIGAAQQTIKFMTLCQCNVATKSRWHPSNVHNKFSTWINWRSLRTKATNNNIVPCAMCHIQ